jgi:uncharacterized protein
LRAPLGILKNLTKGDEILTTKLQQKLIDQATEEMHHEKSRILDIMRTTESYTPILDPMIEAYLDAFKNYRIMYSRWEKQGFPISKYRKSKDGTKIETKSILAEQVRTWDERRTKALEKIGLTAKSIPQTVKTGITTIDNEEKAAEPEETPPDDLQKFRSKFPNVVKGRVSG